MPEHELWLTRRAAAGDQRAFEVLLERNRTNLRNIAATFLDEIDIDEGYSIMVERIWREVLRGHYNPNRGSFVVYASRAAHEALVADWRYRHARMRFAEEAPTSFDALDGYEQPSWSFGANPLRIVMWREALRESVQALSAVQLRAINVYLATDGVRAPRAVIDSMYRARRQTAPLRLI